MVALKGLLQKDWHLNKWSFCLYVGSVILILSISTLMEGVLWSSTLTLVLLVTLFIVKLFYMPFMLYRSLKVEGETMIWLYNPQSGAKLLISKLLLTFLFQISSFIIFNLFALLFVKEMGLSETYFTFLMYDGVFLFTSISISLLVMCLWMIYHTIKKYVLLRKMSWLIIGVLVYIHTLVTLLIDWIGEKTALKITIPSLIDYTYTGNNSEMSIILVETDVYIVSVIMYIGLAYLLFMISSKLLDRAVEV